MFSESNGQKVIYQLTTTTLIIFKQNGFKTKMKKMNKNYFREAKNYL